MSEQPETFTCPAYGLTIAGAERARLHADGRDPACPECPRTDVEGLWDEPPARSLLEARW